PLRPQRPELLGEILLPPAAREWIRTQAPESLIVVPDGALHKLPFEALVLRAGRRTAYVLDELPPLVYAPSVAILAQLAARKPVVAGEPSLLTVAPDYPDPLKDKAKTARPQPTSTRLSPRLLWGQCQPLNCAKNESKRISELFEQRKVLHGA